MILRSPFNPVPPLLRRNSSINDGFITSSANRRRRRHRHRHRHGRRWIDIRAQSPFDEILLSLAPSLQSLLVPAAAAALGACFLISSDRLRFGADRDVEVDGGAVAGDWILFTSPTPFNRSVLLRCPSVSFEDGGELLDGVNDRLVRNERHYVNISRGLIPTKSREGDFADEVCYQRICVGTEDGGVLALDWPENLDIGKEHGLDTTVLIVPGTTEGSMDRNVRVFVHDALKHGYFPIVMNPRGCAGSPLTTARLFTAADSDDICTAIQYVKKARPWTTLMGIGWGYGANMLTKYLAEVGESTPLIAVACIDNPFDLEEATRSFPHHVAMDQKLAGGLVNILRANKELFQGKTKRFDVTKALSATSLRDFDAAISMVSYGFDFIEDFYLNSSTRELVSSVKIPVLFIQSDDGTVPLFSIPRTLIAENPFTSLLLCSCLPSTIISSRRSSILWCQRLAIEWLTGVEFALLKGRHPLLKDVDVTINPLKGTAFVRGRASESGIITEKKIHQPTNLPHLFVKNNRGSFFKLSQSNYVNGLLMDQNNSVLRENDGAIQEDVNDALKQISSINADEDGGVDSLDSEQSQVLQTAAVVMNMLDATMPDTLDDEQKKKVLTAIGQGETLMKALQGAVPEDVRGKLTSAVSEILQNQSTNLNLNASEVKSSVQEKLKEVRSSESSQSDTYFPEHNKKDGDNGVGSQDSSYPKPGDNNTQDSDLSFQDNNVQVSEYIGVGSEVGGKSNQDVKFDKGDGLDERIGEQHKINQKDGAADRNSSDSQMNANYANDVQNTDLKGVDSITEQNMANSSTDSEETSTSVSSTSDQLAIDKKENEVQKSTEEANQNMTDQTSQSALLKAEEPLPQPSPKTPSINVTEALDALTGFDDSTQMAVNNVFGVLEDMIDRFEKASNQGIDDEIDANTNQQPAPALKDSPSTGSYITEKINKRNNVMRVEENAEQSFKEIEDSLHEDGAGPCDEFERGSDNEVKFDPSSSLTKSITQLEGNSEGVNHLDEKNTGAGKNIDKIGHGPNFPMSVTVNPPWMSPHGNYLHMDHSVPLPVVQSLDSDSTTDLFLDTEVGQWKMLDQSNPIGDDGENEHINGKGHSAHYSYQSGDGDEIVEPSYIIVDTEYSGVQSFSTEEPGVAKYGSKTEETKRDELICLVRDNLLEALRVELRRRVAISVLEDIESDLVGDLETVADAVSKSVVHGNELNLNLLSENNSLASEKFGVIEGECIVRTIIYAIQHTSHLREVLPVGVIVGSSLASLRRYFQVAALHDEGHSEPLCDNGEFVPEKAKVISSEHFVGANNQHGNSDKSSDKTNTGLEKSNLDSGSIMVGAVTAALGASALVAQHQKNNSYKQDGALEFQSRVSNNRGLLHEVHNKLKEEDDHGKNQNNLVNSLAEKAMSVAGPVVPTNSDGEVDHERLVAILAELGQKGGMLRLVGKIALLWGGIRGAVSLTDRLISFLHIADRPLFQRVFGFACMALVLWSPVVIPLLPTLVQSWTTKARNAVVEYACIVGLYVATTILVMLWGKRIRGYENPVEQYGVDLTSPPRIHDFLKGLVGGIMMVLSIHSTNALLGYAHLSWPSAMPSFSAGAALMLKCYGSTLILVIRGTVTAFGIALVEELLFRSWFPEEVAADLGYYRAIMISGLAFSFVQRSLHSVPGFFLLSVALFGIKERANGKLAAAIGIRTGVMTTNFFLQTGKFLRYRHDIPFWLISNHPLHPFNGVVGLSLSLTLAILFFPWSPKKSSSSIVQE